jgi:hypothetical protein
MKNVGRTVTELPEYEADRYLRGKQLLIEMFPTDEEGDVHFTFFADTRLISPEKLFSYMAQQRGWATCLATTIEEERNVVYFLARCYQDLPGGRDETRYNAGKRFLRTYFEEDENSFKDNRVTDIIKDEARLVLDLDDYNDWVDKAYEGQGGRIGASEDNGRRVNRCIYKMYHLLPIERAYWPEQMVPPFQIRSLALDFDKVKDWYQKFEYRNGKEDPSNGNACFNHTLNRLFEYRRHKFQGMPIRDNSRRSSAEATRYNESMEARRIEVAEQTAILVARKNKRERRSENEAVERNVRARLAANTAERVTLNQQLQEALASLQDDDFADLDP